MKPKLAVFLLLLSMSLAVPALAADHAFTDVPADAPYYEGVCYLTEQGITFGTGGNKFDPDASITGAQWAVMLCRALDRTKALDGEEGFAVGCLREAYRYGWLPAAVVKEPDAPLCRGALYQSVFVAAGLPVFDYALYPGGRVLSDDENCIRVGAELGLCPENTDAWETVTRGEAACLLYEVLTRELTVAVPPGLEDVSIQNEEGICTYAYLLALSEVPAPILQWFQEEGWIYAIDYQYLLDLGKKYNMICSGATNYQEKRIYLSMAEATLHEFGHFLDAALGFPSRRESFYQEEASEAAAFLRPYGLKNCAEYFADYFCCWVNHHGDAEFAAQMQQLTPKTYEYFTNLAADGWRASGANP